MDLHQSDKLDPDPIKFADDKPKCTMKYDPIFSRVLAFFWKLGSGSRS
jgi:hypothetical protein